ncbi:unnamed protein product, partial [Rotaria sordida]
CTCCHRPYKSSSCQWSISKAIAYTFDERYDYYMHDIHKCLAITKLGHVINGKWTSQKLNAYKQKQFIKKKIQIIIYDSEELSFTGLFMVSQPSSKKSKLSTYR